MLKSFRRMFIIYKGYRGRLIFSQVLLFISVLSMIGVATLNQRLINEGIQAQDGDVIGAHKIMAINGGEIEEIGPHDELMAKKGFYNNLYMSQFRGKLPGSAKVNMSQFVST